MSIYLIIDGVEYEAVTAARMSDLKYKEKEYDMMVARERRGSLTDADHAVWRNHARAGRLVDAIKAYRTLTGEISLKAAKDAVVDWQRDNWYR